MYQYAKIQHYVDDFTHQLHHASQTLGLLLDDNQVSQLLKYLDGLLLWNKAYNLTAIKAPNDALIKHIFDCMAIVPTMPFATKSDINVLDIGTGAGLPAVILAILYPNWQITALDSNSKKIRFVKQMASELSLPNLHPIASRIETFTGEFEIITSRAFASLTDFVALATPYLAPAGVLYAMKGKSPTSEELSCLTKWQVEICPIAVPNLHEERCVVHLKK